MFTSPATLFLKWCLSQFHLLCPVEPSSSLIVMCTISTPDRQIIYIFQSSILVSVSFPSGSGGRNYGITLLHCHQTLRQWINLNTSSEFTSWITNFSFHPNTHTLLHPHTFFPLLFSFSWMYCFVHVMLLVFSFMIILYFVVNRWD